LFQIEPNHYHQNCGEATPFHYSVPNLRGTFGRARRNIVGLDYPDKEINELVARGIGEIGLARVAAANAEAVHHATGVRVRELPVKIEDLLAYAWRATMCNGSVAERS